MSMGVTVTTVTYVLVAILVRTASSACTEDSETDCALNGICTKGQCICDPGWQGEKCNHLKLKPPSRSEPHGYYNGSMQTWGGDVIYKNGLFHAFLVAKGFDTLPLDESDSYSCNTAIDNGSVTRTTIRITIARLEGPSPLGQEQHRSVCLRSCVEIDGYSRSCILIASC